MARKATVKPIVTPEKDPTNTKKGRPRNDIDWPLFEQLCGIQCTRSELASFLKVDQDTMITAAKKFYENDDFSEIYKKFTETGKCSLRRYQFVQAKTKPNMAIWLGKQWLGQKENVTDLKDLMVHELRAGIRQISQESGSQTTEQSALETQPSLPDS